MKHLVDRVCFTFFGDLTAHTFCGQVVAALDRRDSVVFEAVFADCGTCLMHRTQARHSIKGRSTNEGQVNRSGETVASEPHHTDAVPRASAGAGTGGPADDLPPPMPERGARALALLKELLRTRNVQHGHTEYLQTWDSVREFLAEDAPRLKL